MFVLEKAAERNEYMEHQKKVKNKFEELKYEKVIILFKTHTEIKSVVNVGTNFT